MRQRLVDLVAVIKKLPGFTPAIGQDLDLYRTPGGEPPDFPTLLLVQAIAGAVTFKWNKSTWSGIKVQSRLAGSDLWIDLDTDHFSPFVDTRPLAAPGAPEMREYRTCYLNKDALAWSAVLVVTVQPA